MLFAALALLCCGLVVGFGSCSEPSGPVAEPRAGPTREPPVAATEPVEVRLHNPGTEPLELETAFGPAGALALIDLEGALAPMGVHAPPHLCECPCEQTECPCESPPASIETIAPGARHVIRWDGRIRRISPRGGWRCYDAVPPPPGRYLLRACDRYGRQCALSEVRLPAAGPIELSLVRRPEAGRPSCDDRALVGRAVRLALATATLEGVEDRFLTGCRPEEASCEESPVPSEPAGADRCRVQVAAWDGVLAVRIDPAPADAAPLSIEARIDDQAVALPLRASVSATAWGVAQGGRLRAVGVEGRHRHTHGGEAARIGSSSFRFENRTGAAVRLRVERVEPLRSYSCERPGPDDRTLAVTEIMIGAERSPAGPVSLPPGESTVRVITEPMSAYQGHCERFGMRVTFDAGGEPLITATEHHVIRMEPLHKRP